MALTRVAALKSLALPRFARPITGTNTPTESISFLQEFHKLSLCFSIFLIYLSLMRIKVNDWFYDTGPSFWKYVLSMWFDKDFQIWTEIGPISLLQEFHRLSLCFSIFLIYLSLMRIKVNDWFYDTGPSFWKYVLSMWFDKDFQIWTEIGPISLLKKFQRLSCAFLSFNLGSISEADKSQWLILW